MLSKWRQSPAGQVGQSPSTALETHSIRAKHVSACDWQLGRGGLVLTWSQATDETSHPLQTQARQGTGHMRRKVGL